MWSEDVGVAIARWEPAPGTDATAAIGDGVEAFAGAHGMAATGRADVRAAVSDVVARLRRPDERHVLVVDAATDGEWLSVRVRAGGHQQVPSLDGSLPLVQRLAHRIEWEADERGSHLLMEFALGHGAAAPPRHPHCGERRRRGTTRRPSRRR